MAHLLALLIFFGALIWLAGCLVVLLCGVIGLVIAKIEMETAVRQIRRNRASIMGKVVARSA